MVYPRQDTDCTFIFQHFWTPKEVALTVFYGFIFICHCSVLSSTVDPPLLNEWYEAASQ